MNKKIKALWVKALRSGKYRQGRDALKQRKGTHTLYCVLGVLCQLMDSKGWVKRWVRGKPVTAGSVGDFVFKGSLCEGLISSKLRREVGLTKKQTRTIIDLNDGDGTEKLSFSQIADYIEKKF